eukprot:TRINITY_DN8611_c0_g1_i1.p1 TRINITY_DN8611_c0_g1~~TRINITY_DN8611_c0_g1_i1.p1  ORF type:complete len:394 (+),score=98.67 TRINITY_DN8611_c0_g1_i1:739-1920(+)
MQRQLAAERMEACMSISGSTTASCKGSAKTLMQQYSSATVTDQDIEDALLLYRSDLYDLVYNPLLTACNQTNFTKHKTCIDTANNRSISTGGSVTQSDVETSLNALRKSASLWCSCRDSGTDESTCKQLAKTLYSDLAGSGDDWEQTTFNHAEALATAYCAGELTKIERTGVVEFVAVFPVDCTKLDPKKIIGTIEQKILAIDPAFVVTFLRQVQDEDKDTLSNCYIKAEVTLGKSAFSVEGAAAQLAGITLSAGVKGRRVSADAVIYSAEAILECAIGGCYSNSTEEALYYMVLAVVSLFLCAVVCMGGLCLGSKWLGLIKRCMHQKGRKHEEIEAVIAEHQHLDESDEWSDGECDLPALEMGKLDLPPLENATRSMELEERLAALESKIAS